MGVTKNYVGFLNANAKLMQVIFENVEWIPISGRRHKNSQSDQSSKQSNKVKLAVFSFRQNLIFIFINNYNIAILLTTLTIK